MKTVTFNYPSVGTCGEEVELFRICLTRVMCIPDLIIGFDGIRDGWTIGGSFSVDSDERFEFKEIVFIPRGDFEE